MGRALAESVTGEPLDRDCGRFTTQAWVGEEGERADGEKLLTLHRSRHRASPENKGLAMIGHCQGRDEEC